MKKAILFAIIIAFTTSSFAQKLTKLNGDYKNLNGIKNIKLEFIYDDNLKVGKTTEAEYIKEKKAKYNEKNPGDGDKWETNWKADRDVHYKPKFEALFNKVLAKVGVSASDAMENYDCTLVIHTYFIEPGFNIGIMKKPALVNWYATFSDKEGNVLLKIDSQKATGVGGGDYDSGVRVGESYAKGAKTLAKYLLKKKAF